MLDYHPTLSAMDGYAHERSTVDSGRVLRASSFTKERSAFAAQFTNALPIGFDFRQHDELLALKSPGIRKGSVLVRAKYVHKSSRSLVIVPRG